jgi:YegS/Rv2252/BmrU family lipid kinase
VLLKDIMDKHPASPDGRGADRRRLLVVFNPVAGRRHRRRFEATLEALRALGCALELRETEGAGHAGELAAAADPDVFDALVVAGGDGTINEAINGLIPAGARRAALPLAIVPLGTANVLAAEVGLSTRPQSVARTIAGGRVQSIALGRANGRLFTVMAGAGFDAHVVAGVDTALKRRIGKGAYLWQSARQLVRSSWPRYQVEVDGRRFEAASVIVARGRFYAGRFVVAPDARLEAPEFQVCLFGRGGAWNALRYAAALGLGLLPRLRDYRIVPGREVTIEGPADDPLQGDGDVIARLPVSIKILPDALDLIVPN